MSSWVFGYGSLVWRPGFDFEQRRPGWVEGWVRRFWQGSTDHRGEPGAPGRVVTLVPAPTHRCWGIAYQISETVRHQVFDALDHREQGGYERHQVLVHPRDGGDLINSVVYVATHDNPEFLGDAPASEIASQIARSKGPSGSNREYLNELAAALRRWGEDDPHVFELEELVAQHPH